jgi:hypothetical protein
MNYQILTGLTALVATVALPTVASATAPANTSQPSAPIESKQLIAQSVRASFYGTQPGEGGPLTANQVDILPRTKLFLSVPKYV